MIYYVVVLWFAVANVYLKNEYMSKAHIVQILIAKEKVFLYRPTPTCIVCRNWGPDFSMLGPRQLAHFCKLTFRQLLCWGPRQLAYCLLELVTLFLSVVAPPTCTFLYADFSPASVLGPTPTCIVC